MVTTEELLSCKMQKNDSGVNTVKRYFKELLFLLWRDSEGFSGKRPFGNSDWESEVFTAWVTAGLLKGKLDEEGYLQSFDSNKAYRFVYRCIDSL